MTWPLAHYAALRTGPIDPDSLDLRDPVFIAAEMRTWPAWADRYFRADVRGLENLPGGPFLAVANHSGGTLGFDAGIFLLACWRARGPEAPLYSLGHDLVFTLPAPIVRAVQKVGGVRASPANLARIFARGASALVYPGGDIDALRPWSRRNEVVLGSRRGFVRSALRAGVPMVPVVTHGAHGALRILSDGRGLARALRMHRWLRTEVFPLAVGLPWGLFPAYLWYLPLPVKVRVRVLPPVELGLPPSAADDAPAVEDAFERVRGAMQAALTELAAGEG